MVYAVSGTRAAVMMSVLLSVTAVPLLAEAGAKGAEASVQLDCMRSDDAASMLPPSSLAAPDGDLSGCSADAHALACAPSSGEEQATLLPEHGRLLDFDRVCSSASCGRRPDVRRTTVRIFGNDSVRVRKLALSCTLIEEPDPDAAPAGPTAASHAQPVTCGDFTADGNYSASDALGTLRSAVGSASCLICVCDVDNSGSVTATDALRTLRYAVGQPVTLTCPADGNPIAWDAGGDALNWTDPLNWSLDRIPNGCDDATISTGNVQHASGNNAVRSITSSVPLQFKGGTLTVRDSVSATGMTSMTGGTLARADVLDVGTPLTLTSSGGTLDRIHMSADMNMTASSANISVTNGLTLDGTATLGTNAILYFPVSGEVSLKGTGEVLMQHVNSNIYNYGNTNLTIGEDILIHGSAGNVGGNQGNTGMTMEGTVDSDGGGTIDVGPSAGTWTNSGVLRASNGTLRTQGTWTNTGTLEIEPAGTLTLGGSFASATFGTMDRSGGTVNLTGTFDVASGFTLDAGTGDWRLVGGTIRNGTLTSDGGAKILYTSSGGTLSNVVMNAPMDMTASSANVNVTNGLTLNGIATLGTNAVMYFPVSPLVSLTGTGEVLMQHVNSNIYNYGNTNLTIGPDILIHGSAGNVGGNQGNTQMTNGGTIDSDGGGTIDVGPSSGTWTNSGTLRASNGTLRTQGTWSNTGTLALEPAGTLTLGGSFTSAGFGTFDRDGGTVNLTGTFDIASGFTLDASTGDWRLVGGTIRNGTLDAENGAKILYTSSGGTISNVVMNADMDMTASSANVSVTSGLTLNGIATLGTNAVMYFPVSPEVAIDGDGEILMQHVNSNIYNYGNTHLMIGSGILIHGSAGNIGGNQGNTQMTTAATIDSDGGGTLDVGPSAGTWTNTGTLRASNGTLRTQGTWSNTGTLAVEPAGTLTLGGTFTSAGFGTFDRDGGTVNLTGTFDIASGFTLDAGTGNWRLVGGTIRNGTLSSSAGAKILYTSSGGTISNVVMNADMDMTASSANVNVTGGLTLNGVATLGTNAVMYFPVSAEVSLDGTGDVLMQHVNANLYNYGNTHLMIGSGILIHGSAGNIGGNQGNTAMTTAATIDSDAAGTLDVGPSSGTWTNTGTVRASNGTIRTAGTWTNNGTLAVEPMGTLTLGGNFTSAGFGTLDRDGGTVNVTGTFDITSGFSLTAATGDWRLLGGTIKSGTLGSTGGAKLLMTSSGGTLNDVVANANLDMTASSANVNVLNGLVLNGVATLGTNAVMYFPVSSDVSLTGTGDVLLQHVNSNLYNYGNTHLTIGADILIHGSAGKVGGNQGNTEMTNNGEIDSDGGGTIDVGPSAGTWTNNGLLDASAGNLAAKGTFTNAGDIHIGAGRTLSASSGMTQTAAGETALDIAGTSTASFGRLLITGTANLAGPLTLTLTNAFVPALGNTFQIATFTNSTGTFTTVNGLDIPGPNKFQVTYNATNITLTVVPD